MIKQAVHLWITSGIALCCLNATSPARAQIVPDVTLGSKNSTVKPNKDLRSDQIDGGVVRGTNLFHSFREFNIEKGRGVYFTNPDGIENIISRVTGGRHSKILGTLGVLGNANLFLLNPNGILFGRNARLDVRGSFLASTANSLKFAGGKQFSTVAPQTPPLLTVSVPVGLQFGKAAGKIINRSQAQSLIEEQGLVIEEFEHPVGLQVPNGRTLALVGGDVILRGNLTTVKGERIKLGGNLTAKGGRVELGSVAGVGEVSLNQIGNRWKLGYDSVDAFGDIRLERGALVNTSGKGGGDVQVQGRRVTLMDRSWIEASTLGAESGGELNVTASESVSLISGTSANETSPDRRFRRGLFARVEEEATAQGGNITIDTERLIIDGAQITTATIAKDSGGDGGNITIKARQFIVRNGGQVVASTRGAKEGGRAAGDGGNLVVTDSEWLKLTGLSADKGFASALLAQVSEGSTGRGGNITIETGKLVIERGARVSTSVSSKEKPLFSAKEDDTTRGGEITVQASESVELSGINVRDKTPDKEGKTFTSGLGTQVDESARGNGGNITVETPQLIIQDGGSIDATTNGNGSGGDVKVIAPEFVKLIETAKGLDEKVFRSGLYSRVAENATGNGGTITVETQQLRVQDGGTINARSQGKGLGGRIIVRASESVELSGISANAPEEKGFSRLNTETSGIGNAGNLRIKTGLLTVRKKAEVNVSSDGSGKAGNIKVIADFIHLEEGKLNADTTAGRGNIILDSQDLVLRHGSNITTKATGTATGGNINITTGVLAALENSDISADAQEGPGGRVSIDAQGIFGIEFRKQQTLESDITATSNLGPEFSGTVELNTPDVDPSQGLVALPEEVVDISGLIAQGCSASGGTAGKGESKFVVTGRGGLPPSPRETVSNDTVLEDWGKFPLVSRQPQSPKRTLSDLVGEGDRPEPHSNSPASTDPPPPAPASIVEAQGWVINANGEVVLMAQAPTGRPHSPQLAIAACPGN